MKKQAIIIIASAVVVAIGATFVTVNRGTTKGVKNGIENVAKKENEADWIEVKEEEYPTLIKGGLSKDMTEQMLAIGPNHLKEGAIDQKPEGKDFSPLEDMLATVGDTGLLESAGINSESSYEVADWQDNQAYTDRMSLNDMNNLFSFYKDDAFSDYEGAKVQDGMLYINAAAPSWHGKVQILSAKQNGKEMIIQYAKTMHRYDGKEKFYRCKASLVKKEDELFQVIMIESEQDVKVLYQEKLDEVRAGNYPSESLKMNDVDYQDAGDNPEYGKYKYSYCDINSDGVDDLLICLCLPYDRIIAYVSTEDGGITKAYDADSHDEMVFYNGAALVGGSRSSLSRLNDKTGLLFVDANGGMWSESAYCLKIDGEGDTHSEAIYEDVNIDNAPQDKLPSSSEIQWKEL